MSRPSMTLSHPETRSRQLQVLSTLARHRFATTDQLHALVFEGSGLRACQRCLTTLLRRGYVQRIAAATGRAGGGRVAPVHGLSAAGAELLLMVGSGTTWSVPTEAWPDAQRTPRIEHHLMLNRYALGLRAALRGREATLEQWESGRGMAIRYRWKNGSSKVVPHAIAVLRATHRTRHFVLHRDAGTQTLDRVARTLTGYLQYERSDEWRWLFPGFPDVRVVSAVRSRVWRLTPVIRDVLEDWAADDAAAFRAGVGVAVTSEAQLLSDPLGAIWTPAYGDSGCAEPLLCSARSRTVHA